MGQCPPTVLPLSRNRTLKQVASSWTDDMRVHGMRDASVFRNTVWIKDTGMRKSQKPLLVLLAALLCALAVWGLLPSAPTVLATPTQASSSLSSPGSNVCSGCHSGSATSGGSAVVTFSGGTTYTPGVAQTLTVKITDPTHTRGGYQLTSRMASSVSTQAGSFTATDSNSKVASNGSIQDMNAATFSTLSWSFSWTPPTTASGNVTFYLTGLATGSPGGTTSGNGVYQSTATLTPAAGSTTPDFVMALSPTTLSVGQSGTGTSAITLTDINGFTGSVNLAASGLPSGVTAAFSPATATTSSTLTFTASSTATIGTSTVTITGTSGTLSHTATLSLTVTAPVAASFTLAASAASVSVNQGGNGTSSISVTPVSGFTGSVSLAATGMPTGVTAAFSPTTATTTTPSTLTLTAASTTVTGTYTITVTGTSGTLKSTTTISLSVAVPPPPSFTIAAASAGVAIAQSSSGTDIITVTPVGAFVSPVTFAATGVPTGVTASFSPNPGTATSTMTFTVSSTAAQGNSTIIITGTSGTLSSTTFVGLAVTPPSSTSSSTLAASPASVSFSYKLGATVPASQNIQVTASPTALAYMASVSDPTWLSATPASGTTPGTVAIGIIPGALQAGSYSGFVSISSVGALGSPQTIQVALTVTAEQLNTTTTSSSYPNLVIDHAGNFNVAWIDSSSGLIFSRSTNQGVLFSSPLVVPGSAGAAFRPQIVVDSTGNNIYLAWATASSYVPEATMSMRASPRTERTFVPCRSVGASTLSPVPLAMDQRLAG